jgi:FkbM family methyltransferase
VRIDGLNFSGISAKTFTGRLLRWPLRFIPPSMVVRIVQGRLKGKKWIARSSVNGYWLGSYEWQKQMLFVNMVRPGSVVFDIGAHVGYYTLLAAELVGKSGQVFAFEPAPRNLGYLRKHVQLNHCQNVRILPVAVGAESGAGFFEEGGDSSTGHLSSGAVGLSIPVVALDDLIARHEIPYPDYLKIDVEGAELQVLFGAVSILQARQPTIFLATHSMDLHQRCCELLGKLGYQLRPIGGDKLSETDEILAVSVKGDES